MLLKIWAQMPPKFQNILKIVCTPLGAKNWHICRYVSFSFILRENFFLLEIQTLNKLAIFSHSALRHFIETTECLRYWSVKLNSRIYANSPSTQEQWSYFQDHGKHQFSTFSSIHLRSGWCFSCLPLPLFLKIYGCCKEQCNFGQSLGL